MDNHREQVAGAVERVSEPVEQKIGAAVGNERLEARGRVMEFEGNAKSRSAKMRERMKGKLEELAGAAKNLAGVALGSDRMRAEGKARELAGEARKKKAR